MRIFSKRGFKQCGRTDPDAGREVDFHEMRKNGVGGGFIARAERRKDGKKQQIRIICPRIYLIVKEVNQYDYQKKAFGNRAFNSNAVRSGAGHGAGGGKW